MRTPLGEMWLTDDGLLVHRIDRDLIVTAEDARAVQAAVIQLTEGRTVPAIVDMRSVAYAEREARLIFGGSSDQSGETATALIVGSSASQTMAQAFLAMQPDRPIEVFTSETDAFDWARSFLEAAT